MFQNGTLRGTNLLDRRPEGECTLRLLGRYSDSDLSNVSGTFTLLRSKEARKITNFLARRIPKPGKDTSGTKPYILHMIAKNTCRSKVFYSNVSSRYLTCGVGRPVGIQSFLDRLATILR